jgi:hypothetical protein
MTNQINLFNSKFNSIAKARSSSTYNDSSTRIIIFELPCFATVYDARLQEIGFRNKILDDYRERFVVGDGG